MKYLDEISRVGARANPFFTLMGVDVVRFGDGEAEIAMEVRADMLNGAGWLQGGVLTALADEAMALAICTVLDDGGIATINESTSYIRGVRDGSVAATGRVVRKGRRIVFAEGEVHTVPDWILCSRTTAAFAITGS
ncbi:MAG: PaaI family thioesterase [Methanomicrobiales archaeon]